MKNVPKLGGRETGKSEYLFFILLLPVALMPVVPQTLVLITLAVYLLVRKKPKLDRFFVLMLVWCLIYLVSILANMRKPGHEAANIVSAFFTLILNVAALLLYIHYRNVNINLTRAGRYAFWNLLIIIALAVVFLIFPEASKWELFGRQMAVIDVIRNYVYGYRFSGFLGTTYLVIFFIFFNFPLSIYYIEKRMRKRYQILFAFLIFLAVRATGSRIGLLLYSLLFVFFLFVEFRENIQQLYHAHRKATIAGDAIPCLCGTAYRNKGVQKLLDAVIDYLPAPTDIPDVEGTDMEGNPATRESSDAAPFAALAFKIMTDPFVGKLAYFRVYSGTLKTGSYCLNSSKDKKERVGRLLQMHANKRMDLDEVFSGDIAAAVGFKNTTTGDTLCDEAHPIILESMEFPEPVISVAIEPKTKASQGKMTDALAKLAEEDPTFRVRTNEETGQTIISGMGELHLEIIVDRLLREFHVEANVGAPEVAYKETFTKPADVQGRYIHQSGGSGMYGDCKVKFEPMDPNGEETFSFESTVVGGSIPKEYIPAIEKGIREAANTGVLAGYPVLGVHANVYDGSYHEVDSNERAFEFAGSIAFKEAMQKADPVLLEPIMKVEITTPEEYMGNVIGDVNSRRGKIDSMEDIPSGKQINAFVPLSEMFGYATDLRSKTQGRANYSMFFDHYEKCPKAIQDKVVKEVTGK